MYRFYCNTEQENYIKKKILALEKAHANQKSRIAWTIVNDEVSRIIATSPEERVTLWKDHFSNLLGQPPIIDVKPLVKVFDTLPIETDDFTEIWTSH